MMRLMIAGGTYLLLLALIIIFNHGAHKRKAISSEVAFSIAP